MRRLLPVLLLISLLPACARAQAVIADLTDHLIAITTGFTGTRVTLFGAVETAGDLIVVVRGPEAPVTVRRKDRILGLWLNARSATYQGVPGYYAIAATRAPDGLLSGEVLTRQQIGLDYLNLLPTREDLTEGEQQAFRSALIRNRQQAGLFASSIAPVTVLANRLFRVTLDLPSNVPVGYYQVQVYAVRNGQIVGAQTTPLDVQQIGAAAEISDLAISHGWLYGLLSVLASVMVGWLGTLLYRRT